MSVIPDYLVRIPDPRKYDIVQQPPAWQALVFVLFDQTDRAAIAGLGINPFGGGPDRDIADKIQFLGGRLQKGQIAFIQPETRSPERVGGVCLRTLHHQANQENRGQYP
jgi:hypothetical protein